MRRPLLVGLLAGTAISAWGGEIIFVDPVREKAQALQQDGEPVSGAIDGDAATPAGERAREARDYLNDSPTPKPNVIMKSGVPPSDAAKARQAARSWAAPPPATHSSGNPCRTENTVGGIEGTAQGRTVIQSNTTGVTSVCK